MDDLEAQQLLDEAARIVMPTSWERKATDFLARGLTMNDAPHDHTHLWNDLPIGERKRLMPYQMEAQILHLEQAKAVAIRAHKAYLREMNQWVANIRRDLERNDG